MAGILLASLVPNDWGLELAGTLALIPIIVSAIATRSTLAAVAVASVAALMFVDLPYRFSLPIAVFAALIAGTGGGCFRRAEGRARDEPHSRGKKREGR